ncbi:phage minor capsid protein [Enterocloster sp.]|uniref:phage minor capsid protein n=1 Tax=Enterocloster sp. TaxID=2719315 RepID=UPI003A8D2B33
MRMNEYDITTAFKVIENELIASMIRNMDRHRAEETKEGYEWSMWQTEQLKALEKYKWDNQKKYRKQFQKINGEIDLLIRKARETGNMQQEIKILEAIKKGFPAKKISKGMAGEFFRLNDRKLEALIEATTHDMEKAETAILRKAEDDYRQAIYNAQVYANTGAGTYEKAVDMATKDMLSRGINCVQYINGARHTLADYADMAIRTASKRAYLQGEGEKRQEWGIATVIVNKRGNPCPKCLPFCGKVLIDDVWSGGPEDGVDLETGKKYPLMSYAISQGLYHPRCRDSHTTYFPGISTADDTWTKEELEAIGQEYEAEQKQQYAKRQEEKYERLSEYSLDAGNKKQYGIKAREWKWAHFKTGGMNSYEYVQSKRPLANFRALPKEKVVDVLREDSKRWIEKLSEAEKHAIQKYTYNSGDKKPNRFFERLNAMLRGEKPKDEKLEQYSATISKALMKNKLDHDIICYRNMDFNPYKDYPVGKVICAEQFISTSVSKNAALQKKVEMVFFVHKDACGAYIESISKYPKQREFLLDKSCRLRVISNQEGRIILEVL